MTQIKNVKDSYLMGCYPLKRFQVQSYHAYTDKTKRQNFINKLHIYIDFYLGKSK